MASSTAPQAPLDQDRMPPPMAMLGTKADGDEAATDYRNMVSRRRDRERSLFRKVHELHEEHQCEVCLVIKHLDDGRCIIYDSEPGNDLTSPYKKLKRAYPIPEINTPDNPKYTLRKALELVFQARAKTSNELAQDDAKTRAAAALENPSRPPRAPMFATEGPGGSLRPISSGAGMPTSSPSPVAAAPTGAARELGSPIALTPKTYTAKRPAPVDFVIPIETKRARAGQVQAGTAHPCTPSSGRPEAPSPPKAPYPVEKRRFVLIDPEVEDVDTFDHTPTRKPYGGRDTAGRFARRRR